MLTWRFYWDEELTRPVYDLVTTCHEVGKTSPIIMYFGSNARTRLYPDEGNCITIKYGRKCLLKEKHHLKGVYKIEIPHSIRNSAKTAVLSKAYEYIDNQTYTQWLERLVRQLYEEDTK